MLGVVGWEVEAGRFLLPFAVLFSVLQTPALAAELGVVALGQSVAGVEALKTDDVEGLAKCWRLADGGQVAYRVASLAVVAFRTGNRETGPLEQDIAVYLELAVPLLECLIGVELLFLLLLLLRLLRLLRLVVVVLAVAVVQVSRVVGRPPIGLVRTLHVDMRGVRVHVALLISLSRCQIDLLVSGIRVVRVIVAGITITVIDI